MMLSSLKKLGVVMLAVTALVLGTALQAPAHAEMAYQGTMIHVINNTGRTMTFYVDFVTPGGELRYFYRALDLMPGESGVLNTGPYYGVATHYEAGQTRYLIRVTGVTQYGFVSIWGVRSSDANVITGLLGCSWGADGFRHISVSLI